MSWLLPGAVSQARFPPAVGANAIIPLPPGRVLVTLRDFTSMTEMLPARALAT